MLIILSFEVNNSLESMKTMVDPTNDDYNWKLSADIKIEIGDDMIIEVMLAVEFLENLDLRILLVSRTP